MASSLTWTRRCSCTTHHYKSARLRTRRDPGRRLVLACVRGLGVGIPPSLRTSVRALSIASFRIAGVGRRIIVATTESAEPAKSASTTKSTSGTCNDALTASAADAEATAQEYE